MGKRKIDYDTLPEADVVVEYIKKRKKKGLYSLILTTGLPGTGKSSIDLRLAEKTNEELGGDGISSNNVIDDILDLITFIKNADPKKVCIGVIEEISVLFPSRRAMSHDNVVVGKLLDTARKKQVILFANAPIFPAIDKHMRCLGNIYIETLRINRGEEVVVAKALRMQTNPGSGKTYFHWLKRKGKEVHRIFVRKPTADTWKEYENRKDKFLDDLYQELKEKTEKKQGKKLKGPVVKPLTPSEIKVYDLLIRKEMKQADIAKELKVSAVRVSHIVKALRKKINIKNNSEKEEKVNEIVITTTPLVGNMTPLLHS